MDQSEKDPVVGAIPKPLTNVRDAVTDPSSAVASAGEVLAEMAVEAGDPPNDLHSPAHVEAEAQSKLPWRQRLQNRIRMAVCNWLGITYALQQIGFRVGGNRMDIDALAAAMQKNAELLERVVRQTNQNTHLINAWKNGYPILGKIAAEERARMAQAAAKKNGKGGLIIATDGSTLSSDTGGHTQPPPTE